MNHLPGSLQSILSAATGPFADPEPVGGLERVWGLLRPAQRAALSEAWHAATTATEPHGPRGIVGLLGCGHGKTLVAQMLPGLLASERPLYVIPAALQIQFAREAWLRRQFPVTHPTPDKVLTYEMLSQPQARDRLFKLRPDLIVFDEAHMLGNPDSARWTRIARYLDTHWPRCRVCVLSGTLISRSVRQMSHLFFAALRDWSCLPQDETGVNLWSSVVDLESEPGALEIAKMAPLARWASQPVNRDGIRRGFARLVSCSPGVVVSHGVSADVSITGAIWAGPPRPPALDEAIKKLGRTWNLPDGTELIEALEHDRAQRQLAYGYWSRWVPGTGHPLWFERRKAWNALVRWHMGPDLESPAIVAGEAREARLGHRAYQLWKAWRDVAHIEPDSETVWMDDGPPYVRDVVRVYLAGVRGQALVWYHHRAMAAATGLPAHGGGSLAPTGGSAAVSIPVHGKGWNGQAYHQQLVLEPMSSAGTWEQLLSRTHRPGQTEDVTVTIAAPTPYLQGIVWRAVEGGRFLLDTTGEAQRILMLGLAPPGREHAG